MPLYEYECESCGTRFERIQKFSDPRIEVCPACGGHVKRLVSSPAIKFKGSGWYVTDYAKKSTTDAGKTGDSGSSSSSKNDTSNSSETSSTKKTE